MSSNWSTVFLLFLIKSHCLVWGIDLNNTSDQEIYRNILDLVKKGKLKDSVPYVDALVGRLEQRSTENPTQLSSLYFFGGIGYSQSFTDQTDSEKLDKALVYFEKYNIKFPDGDQAHTCFLQRGEILRKQGKWLASNETLIKLYKNLYLMNRLTTVESQEVLQQIVENFYIVKDWENGYPWFSLLLKTSSDPMVQSRASIALIEYNLQKNKFASIKEWLPYLSSKNPVRYEIGFNIALLNIAQKLSKKKEAAYATFIYGLVIDTQEITRYHQRRKSELEEQLIGLSQNFSIDPEELDDYEEKCRNKIQQSNKQLEILQNPKSTSYVPPYAKTLKWLKAKNYLAANRTYESFWAFYKIIKDYPEYTTNEEIFYSAFSLAIKISFYKEAEELGKEYLNNTNYQEYRRSIAVKLGKLYIDQKKYSKFSHLVNLMVSENNSDDYAAQLISMLGAMYLKNGDLVGMKEQFKNLLKSNPNNHSTVAGCTYWHGLAHLLSNELNKAKIRFQEIIRNYPNSHYYPEAKFRYASIFYSLEKWEKANLLFEEFVLQYPETILVPEAESFMGDMDAHKGKLQQALQHYQKVKETVNIKKNPQQIDFIAHATFQSTKLLEQNRRPKEAIQIYLDFIEKHPDAKCLAEIIYSLGTAYEKSNNPGQMLKVWIDAVVQYGDNPSANGIDRILEIYVEKFKYHQKKITINQEILKKLYSNLEERSKMVTNGAYRYKQFINPYIDKDLIKMVTHNRKFRSQFVKNPEILNPIIAKYQNMHDSFVKESPKVTFTNAYQKAFSENRPTLGFRIQMVLDQIGELGNPSTMIFSEEDFQVASPATLHWMGKKMQDIRQLEIAKKAYLRAITRYPRSSIIPKTLLALAELELLQENLLEAIRLFLKVETRFPNTKVAASAILGRGKILLLQKKYPQAREVFQSILKNRDWRGERFFKAQYSIGKTHYQEGDLQEALSFFERAYFGGVQFRTTAILSLQNIIKILLRLEDRKRAQILIQEFMDNNAFFDYYMNSMDTIFREAYESLKNTYNQF